MNIIIPLGGKGERFLKNGFSQPKPLIPIFEKHMIQYVLDNLNYANDDHVFIFYNPKLDLHGFSEMIQSKYPNIHLISIDDTRGAAETLLMGIEKMKGNYVHHKKSIILDCDTFYTQDILDKFRNAESNMIFYTKDHGSTPIYSYIEMNNENKLIDIKEKVRISDNANTGAYAFLDIDILHHYCKHVVEKNIYFNGEPYTSCVISEMIKDNHIFRGHELQNKSVFSLGTPVDVKKHIDRTHAFLFDLDGTLVRTDDIYFNVWSQLLEKYNITMTDELFLQFIQGNNDNHVLKTLLPNVNITLLELSRWKDELFIENIQRVKIVDGVKNFMEQIKRNGHKMCIVTNCSGKVAREIVKLIEIDKYVDFIISMDDCLYGKPNGEPYKKAMERYNICNTKCFIFEDSKTGILSAKNVNPKLIVGIETLYNAQQMTDCGVEFSIKDFSNIDINDLLHVKDKKTEFVNMIKMNSSLENIKNVVVDNTKLKGGFIADVISFKIITNNDTEHHQILKYENELDNNLSTMAKNLELYEREYYFYTDISSKVKSTINIPKFFNLVKNLNGQVCGIVLENLNKKNYKINLNLNVETIDTTLKIIDRMARLHSLFWGKNMKELFPKLKGSCDVTFCPFFERFVSERRELFINKWRHTLNSFQLQKCNYIFDNFSDIQRRFSIGNNITFIHGDIKSPNIFYDIDNMCEPCFIDWQHCAIGKGVQDLIFFLIESFDVSNIKNVFHIGTHYYYKKLLEYGVIYDFDEYERDIHDAICYIPFFTSVWFGTISQDELIDKNFPYFLISKMFYLLEMISKK